MDLPTFPSIGPEIWGRSFWEFLDAIIATYPRENPSTEHRGALYNLLHSLQHLLPCPTCRKHYQEFLHTRPLDLSSRKSLMEFYFTLKRDIAVRTGKPFPFRSPDELWHNITRRLRLARNGPIATPKPIFRVPGRVNQLATATKKGCGCGGKK